MGEHIQIDSAEGPVPTYVAAPEGEARGAVVVVQEAFGLTPHICSVADRLSAKGWLAVTPALFWRSGAPVFDYGDFSQIGPVMGAMSAEGIANDVDAAIAHAGSLGHDAASCGIVGFCMGGSVSFTTAARRPLGAAVTFYGGGVVEGRFGSPSLVDDAPNLQTPWLGLFGDLDKGIPPEQVEQLRTAVGAATVDAEIVRYPDAEHGFNCDDRASYHQPSADDAWARTLAWFDAHLA